MNRSSLYQRITHRITGIAVLSLVGLFWLFAPQGRAQRPNRPPYFAIENVRIVPVSGAAIEKGTVVIANGLIQAVGPNVAIPPEAWRLDGSGLTVFPGLIDALSNMGMQPPSADGGQGGQRGTTRPAASRRPARPPRGPEDRAATTPWESAADRFRADQDLRKTWREAGFTTVVTAPDRGIFPGQAAVINLSDGETGESVVKSPAALRINLRGAGSRRYPASLMGVIAYVRQLFLDAEHYGQAWELYESNPAGLERPAYDRSLAPLVETKRANRPVLLPGNQAREIRRAARLGEELGLRTVIYGAQHGYEVASNLSGSGAAVLVNLKWPEKEKNADPDREETLRTLRHRRDAPSTPAALRKAGVRFAFYSGGISVPKKVRQNVLKAVEAGLESDAALRAMTLDAAEIYGVSDRLGSIEPGKIANLVVADGSLFEKKTKIKMVFVDGELYEIREADRPKDPPDTDMTGDWTITVEGPRGTEERTMTLAMETDGTLSGTMTTRGGEADISEGWVSGNKFSITLDLSRGGRTFKITYTGTVKEDSVEGTLQAGPRSVEFTGRRVKPDAQLRSAAGR